MHLHHAAIWARDLEGLREFYEKYFQARSGARYHNPVKGFTSYFLTFDTGARLELMHRETLDSRPGAPEAEFLGLAHLAFSVGSREAVAALTETLRAQGLRVLSEPRTTGDGYFESCVLDPEGNRLEITE